MRKMNLTTSVISPSLSVNTGLQPRRMDFEEGATRWKILRSGWNSACERRGGKIAKKKMIVLTAEIIPLVDDKDDRLVHRAASQ